MATYDEIDMIYKFVQSVEELESTGFENYVFADSRESVFFEYFLLPSFSSLVENIKKSLNEFADHVIGQINMIVLVTYVVEAVILMVGFGLAVYRITTILQSFIIMLQVYTEFHVSEIHKISRYCINLFKIFKQLMTKHK